MLVTLFARGEGDDADAAVGLELFVVVAVATFVLRLYSERLGTERGGTVEEAEAEDDSLLEELRRAEGGSGGMVGQLVK